MSRIYAQQKRPGAQAAEPSYRAPAVHAPSLVSVQSSSDLDALMQAKYRQHFLDNQIPTAEAEADRIAASVSGARTPEEVKTQLGEKMGADFSNVTFHTDSAALKQADAMGARAYTTGSDVYFGSGGFDPGVAAHELVHTVQQGMVGSTMGTTSAPTGGVQMAPGRGVNYDVLNVPLISHFKKKSTSDPEEFFRELMRMRLFLRAADGNANVQSDSKFKQINNLYPALLTMANTKEFATHMSTHVGNISKEYLNSIKGQPIDQVRDNADLHNFSTVTGLYDDIVRQNIENGSLDPEVNEILESAMDTDTFNEAYEDYTHRFDRSGGSSLKYASDKRPYLNYTLPNPGNQPEPTTAVSAQAAQPSAIAADRKAVSKDTDTQYRMTAQEILGGIIGPKNVDLGDMNGKTMLKNAKGFQKLASKFQNLKVNKITQSRGLGSNTFMGAGIYTRDMLINPSQYKSKQDAGDPNKLTFQPQTGSGSHTANKNYSLSHETGHIVNYHLADKLNNYNGKKTYRNRLYGSGFHGSNHAAVSRILLTEALLQQAGGGDEKLQNLLLSHTNLQNMKDFDTAGADNIKSNKRKLADALKSTKEGSLLAALHEGGYTSAYGATHADEMYAEAFAQHVRNENKREKGKERQARNPLSDTIVALSQKAYDNNDNYMGKLYRDYGNDKKTSFWTALKRKLFGD